MADLMVEDMTCGHCVSAVTRAVKSVDPAAQVRVDLGSGRVHVEGDRTAAELAQAISAAGYPAAPVAGAAPQPMKAGGCCGGCG